MVKAVAAESLLKLLNYHRPHLWEECRVPLHVSIMRIRTGNNGDVRYWGLATTYRPSSAAQAFDAYAKRTCIEERQKQFKNTWNIGRFSSPGRSQVETHVLFTILTYSLVQLYLIKKHLAELGDKTIDSLRQQERQGKNSVVVYGKHNFAVFNLDEYTSIVAHLQPQARDNVCAWLERFRKNDKMRTDTHYEPKFRSWMRRCGRKGQWIRIISAEGRYTLPL